MTAKEMLTTREVARYLNIHEKQVYLLLKARRIPATKVTGKWLFPRRLIEEWIMESAQGALGGAVAPDRLVIAGSHDLALDLLFKQAALRHPRHTYSLATVGSWGGLVALQGRRAQAAAVHLLDPASGEYNLPFIHAHLADRKLVGVHLGRRGQGLMVLHGNPKRIRQLGDLKKRGLRFINRQEGSGTRLLLDFLLKRAGMAPQSVSGYETASATHMEVALAVLGGAADAGLGIASAARAVGLDFIPLAEESFDLLFAGESWSLPPARALAAILRSSEFKEAVLRLGGYDVRETGRVFYERS
jgi:putative molybdopterin biosynthesis protein